MSRVYKQQSRRSSLVIITETSSHRARSKTQEVPLRRMSGKMAGSQPSLKGKSNQSLKQSSQSLKKIKNSSWWSKGGQTTTMFNAPMPQQEDLEKVPSWLTPLAVQPSMDQQTIKEEPLQTTRSRLYKLLFGPAQKDYTDMSANSDESSKKSAKSLPNPKTSELFKSLDNISSQAQRKKSTHSVKETSQIESVCTSPVHSPINTIQVPLDATQQLFQQLKVQHNLPHIEGMINQYVLIKEIGEGSFSKVWLVYDLESGKYYACKCISKKKLRKMGLWKQGPERKKKVLSVGKQFDYMDYVRHEIAILKKLSKHPNIATLVEVLDDVKYDTLYMVFELCEYGSLMKTQATKLENFSEALSRRYFRDIVVGLEYLHSKNIIHRDLKVDNVLLKADNHCVIGDFGISFSLSMIGNVGKGNGILTPSLTPPECVDQQKSSASLEVSGNDTSIDIWCLGITLYTMLHGQAPFVGKDMPELFESILRKPVLPIIKTSLSADCKDLICQLLCKDRSKRITLAQVRKHPWVTSNGLDELPLWFDDAEEGVCTFVSSDEVRNAVRPGMTMMDRIRERLTTRTLRRASSLQFDL